MKDVFGYNIYDKIMKVRGEVITILLIGVLQAPGVEEDSYRWKPPEPRLLM